MDEQKKVKKGGKKDEAAAAGDNEEVVFGNSSGNDMVNFGGGAIDDESFGEKQREPNIIRKFTCSNRYDDLMILSPFGPPLVKVLKRNLIICL